MGHHVGSAQQRLSATKELSPITITLDHHRLSLGGDPAQPTLSQKTGPWKILSVLPTYKAYINESNLIIGMLPVPLPAWSPSFPGSNKQWQILGQGRGQMDHFDKREIRIEKGSLPF